MKYSSLITQIINGLLIVLSFLWTFIFIQHSGSLTWKGIKLVTQSNWLGVFSTWTGLVAFTLFVLKARQKKHSHLFQSRPTKRIFQYVYFHHILFGVTTFFTALAHGIYFLLHFNDDIWKVASGWIGLACLAALVLVGIRMIKKEKKRKVLQIHRWLGILFTFSVFLHAGGWQVTFLLFITMVFIGIIIIKKVKTYLLR
ncbi:hypothetical protein MUN89_17995 [Halobacillus salinarum]|uniref:Ferric oxidoreductase domain-containing protein n=1 Tax=Halobacillus salinarum TaxID=2932257 RepID=A0ABY4EI66_9BACI|nr:hypothetical protein [Halobacillus salinarum]UOQ43753.1 hypothetical protein MUN89_17995 [Halobacillus salinarum]